MEKPRRKPSIVVEEAHPDGRTLDSEALRALLARAAEQEEAALHAVTVVLAGRERVLRLNRTYLDHDYATDVLAFPLSEESQAVEGEIYIDLDTAAERCAEFDATAEEEARRYALHGLLHLLGYEDKTEEGQRQMRAREERYLTGSR